MMNLFIFIESVDQLDMAGMMEGGGMDMTATKVCVA
jgi:hypothetical protein